MCKHKNVIYLGKQQADMKGKNHLYLFNCEKCHSTIVLPAHADTGNSRRLAAS